MSKTEKPKGKYSVVIKYILILLGSGLFGGVIGAGMMLLRDQSGAIGDKVTAFMSVIILPAQWIVFLLFAAISIALYLTALGYVKKLAKNREDDDIAQKADNLISWGITLCSVSLIVGYWLFGLNVSIPQMELTTLAHIPRVLESVVVVLLLMAYYSVYMAFGVKLVKRINPEKRGDPLDTKFQKDWINSCDEGEKMVIYQASYQSHRLVGAVLLIVWVVTVMCSIFFGLGGYTITIVSIIWLAHTIGYQWYAMKLDKKKMN